MTKGIETRVKVLRWGIWNNEKGRDELSFWGDITQRNVEAFSLLASAVQDINEGGWRVVTTLPIQQGQYFAKGLMNHGGGVGNSGWGGGYGWGASATAGTALILQRDIDDAGSTEAAARARSYSMELERVSKAWEIRYTPIERRTVKTGMLKTVDEYVFGQKVYPSLESAEEARAALAIDAEQEPEF